MTYRITELKTNKHSLDFSETYLCIDLGFFMKIDKKHRYTLGFTINYKSKPKIENHCDFYKAFKI